MNTQKKGPSALFYVFGILVILAGVVLFVVFLIQSLAGLGDSLTQVVVPGKKEIQLSETGHYTVFHEYKSSVDGRLFVSSANISNLQCSLVSKQTGEQVQLTPSSTNATYSLGSRAGYSILEFDISNPGTYEFAGSYAGNEEGPEVVLAIGHGFLGGLLQTVFGGMAIMFGGFLAGILIIVVTFVKRYGAKKRQVSQFA